MKVDAVVTFHSKDRELLPWCIRGIRNHLEVARILVVASRGSRQDVERTDAIFVDEDSVVESLTASFHPSQRWGWYFQQILKLGMADRVDTDYYLVVDADTVFLRRVTFFNDDGKPLYATSTEYCQAYFDVFEHLLGFIANREYSFITNHMVFHRDIVKEMRSSFRGAVPWYMCIVKYVEPQAPWYSEAQFSEYETYGHYIKAFHPDELNVRPLRWRTVDCLPTEGLRKKFAKLYDFCTFHESGRKRNGVLRRFRSRLRLEIELLREERRSK
jgi:hypothetical protein